MSGLRGTVLVAEDDRDQREILTEVFEYEGYRVLTASTAKQALARFAEGGIDVVLLDVHGIHEPAIDVALAKMGRERPAVIVVSGDCDAADTANAISAEGVVSKPYELVELLSEVSRVIADRGPRLRLLDGGLGLAAAV